MRGTGAATWRAPLTSVRPFQGLPGLLLARRQESDCLASAAIVLHGLALPSRSLGWPSQALSAVSCRTSATSGLFAAVAAFSLTRRLVVSGRLSTNSALLIDRSAEPVESSLPCSWLTLAPLHAGTRLATSSCRAPRARCETPVKKSLFVLSRHSRHSRIVPPTDLDWSSMLVRTLANRIRTVVILRDHFWHTLAVSFIFPKALFWLGE